jgi:hypothetical protein
MFMKDKPEKTMLVYDQKNPPFKDMFSWYCNKSIYMKESIAIKQT